MTTADLDALAADLALLRVAVAEDTGLPSPLDYVLELVVKLAHWQRDGELTAVRFEWAVDQGAAAMRQRGHPPAVVEHWVGTLREQFDAV